MTKQVISTIWSVVLDMKTIIFKILIIVLASSFALAAENGGIANGKLENINPPVQDWFSKAPALPKANRPSVLVSDIRELVDALNNAKPGQTIFRLTQN